MKTSAVVAAREAGLHFYDRLYGRQESWSCADCGTPQLGRDPYQIDGKAVCGHCIWQAHEEVAG